MIVDKTNEIFDEVYSEIFIDSLIINTIAKYPWLVNEDPIAVRSLAISEEKVRRYYSQDASIISNHLAMQYEENKIKGYNNE